MFASSPCAVSPPTEAVAPKYHVLEVLAVQRMRQVRETEIETDRQTEREIDITVLP